MNPRTDSNEDWLRVEQTKWIYTEGGKVIEICSVMEPENDQNFIAIYDEGDKADVIGYFKDVRSAVIGTQEYIGKLEKSNNVNDKT